MLPIANRKTLQVPHGLAALAAAVCLVLAFATDQSSVEGQLNANQSGQQPVEHVVDDGKGMNDNTPASKREQRERREQGSNLALLPWFPGLGGGRQ